jgi:hypothetical protein
MVMDLSAQMMQATVQLEQPLGDGTRTVGTGFLISETTPDGKAHVILVTANHVFDKMPKTNARIGYRFANADGSWSYSPQNLKIRDGQGHPCGRTIRRATSPPSRSAHRRPSPRRRSRKPTWRLTTPSRSTRWARATR